MRVPPAPASRGRSPASRSAPAARAWSPTAGRAGAAAAVRRTHSGAANATRRRFYEDVLNEQIDDGHPGPLRRAGGRAGAARRRVACGVSGATVRPTGAREHDRAPARPVARGLPGRRPRPGRVPDSAGPRCWPNARRSRIEALTGEEVGAATGGASWRTSPAAWQEATPEERNSWRGRSSRRRSSTTERSWR